MDTVITNISFNNPSYQKLQVIVELPVHFTAYINPSSPGEFLGKLIYDGDSWDLQIELLSTNSRLTFYKKKERVKSMIGLLLVSEEYLAIKETVDSFIMNAGANFYAVVDKWQNWIYKMLEYNRLYTLIHVSEKGEKFIQESKLAYAKYEGIKFKPTLVFKHPHVNWILLLLDESSTGIKHYSRSDSREKLQQYLSDEDKNAIIRLVKQGYYHLGCRAVSEIYREFTGLSLKKAHETGVLNVSSARRNLARSLMSNKNIN